jgi:ATP-dependent exoDNAse (exonuclease V) alpha subunit
MGRKAMPALRQAEGKEARSRMAIFHLNAKIISRGKGQSAIAAAAYRSGERLRDEQANEQKFYKARAERIVFTEIMAPKGAPEWAYDRNQLWNEAERAEKRKDAQLAREIEISLPHEITEQQREWLVKDFAREAFVRKGYAVDIAIHAPNRESDERNHHAHIMVTRRTLGPDGFSKTKDWKFDKKQLGQWREQWAHLANRHLERYGHEERIDHRSLKEQGAEREATTHLGYAANEMAQRGAQSDRFDQLRAVLARNDIRVIDTELRTLERDRTEREGKGDEEDDRRRRHKPTPDNPEWTDRAGMVAQERSAMDLVRAVDRARRAGKPLRSVEERSSKPKSEREPREPDKDDRER